MNCNKCGELLPDNARFCKNCGQSIEAEPAAVQPEAPDPVQKKENVFTGTIGALIGAALGAGAIILLSQLGYVASVSGLVLAVCTLKGYELLGGHLGTKGIIISIILMLVTPYLADRIDWAIVIMNAYADQGVTFAESFAAVPALIEEEAIEMGEYVKNLLMVYGFTALGAFATVKNLFKKK